MNDFNTEQKLRVSFKIQDKNGRPVNVENGPRAISSDETVVQAGDVSKDGDRYVLDLKSVAEGPYRVVVVADTNMNTNEMTQVLGIIEGNVTRGERTDERMIELVADEPIDD